MKTWRKYCDIAHSQPKHSIVWVCPLDVEAMLAEFKETYHESERDSINSRRGLLNGEWYTENACRLVVGQVTPLWMVEDKEELA